MNEIVIVDGNLFSQVDLGSKLWVCPFCQQRNTFPPQYSGMSETQLPAELLPTATTIEYALPRQNRGIPPVFLFVVDICLSEEESQALKDSLLQTLELIPQNSLVGLITFGTTVRLLLSHCAHTHTYSLFIDN
jgi:protein transport protein SEC23